MRRNKKGLALLLALLLPLAMLLSGCAQSAGPAASAEAVPTQEAAGAETAQDAVAPPEEAAPQEREITDMAGRTMTVPLEIESVFSTGPAAAIYLYTLVPDKLLGWNYALNDIEKSIILEQYHDLPNFGQGDAVNYEAVIAAGPTIALNVTSINDGSIDASDALAEQLGVPVVMVSSDLLDAPAVYRFMGELFGVEEQAEALAAYAEETFNAISSLDIPNEEKVRIYYGNGEDSLETAPAGSSHGQIIDLVNAVNVADLELGDGSRVQISAEQLLAWDPDVIIVNGEPKADMTGSAAAEAILADPLFATLKAVQNGAVYGTPNAPFSWVDRPPGPNRIVGMRWLSGLIYPEYLDYDVDEAVREFFQLFYHVELTDEQLTQLYNGTL
ncbi:MAG: Fe3+-hydroxamate ABC transporter substrate-binding protein [Clostridiales bacterium]|nr:MAG: Fe3+-hydroxamate ABC transporter substrate-binding protein [Clostridiales bacterium]